MDSFDYSDDALEPAQDSTSVIWNILTVIVILMTVCLCTGFGYLLINPQSSVNPFPPPTMPVEAELPTATPTPKSVLTSYLDTGSNADGDRNTCTYQYTGSKQYASINRYCNPGRRPADRDTSSSYRITNSF